MFPALQFFWGVTLGGDGVRSYKCCSSVNQYPPPVSVFHEEIRLFDRCSSAITRAKHSLSPMCPACLQSAKSQYSHRPPKLPHPNPTLGCRFWAVCVRGRLSASTPMQRSTLAVSSAVAALFLFYFFISISSFFPCSTVRRNANALPLLRVVFCLFLQSIYAYEYVRQSAYYS